MSADSETAGAVAGLCLLLVTVVGFAVVPRPALRPGPRDEATLDPAGPRLPQSAVDRRARASPDMLQRFLN